MKDIDDSECIQDDENVEDKDNEGNDVANDMIMVKTIAIFKEMFLLQSKLNLQTNGDKWLNGKTKDGKTIDWLLCCKMELAEATDCFNWKHWKNIDKVFDLENYKMEMLDIVHFAMSSILEISYHHIIAEDKANFAAKVAEYQYADLEHKSYDDVIEYIINSFLSSFNVEVLQNELITMLDTIETNVCGNYPELLEGDLSKMHERVLLNITKHIGIYFSTHEDFFANIALIFVGLKRYYGFGLMDVYKMYLAKNTLNIFRQEHGYKLNTYTKIWNGVEDNDYVHRFLKEAGDDDVTFSKLYEYLEHVYLEVKDAEQVIADNCVKDFN